MTEQTPTKKILNEVKDCVHDNLIGYTLLHTGLELLEGDHRVVVRADLDSVLAKNQVVILTGGGSGHEPAFAGYLGPGMASLAVHGAIFASPPPGPILTALRRCGPNHKAGVLLVINNYTGDLLNFGIAKERALAEGINVKMIANADDSAVLSDSKKIDRRGLAGIVLMLKVLGSMAEQGCSMDEIMKEGLAIVDRIRTLGCCLSPCSTPGGPLLFRMPVDRLEVGLGLHGETGVSSIMIQSASKLVKFMLDHMTLHSSPNRIQLIPGEDVVVLLNNLGATSELEMNIVVKEVLHQLDLMKVKVVRLYVNRFITSQEMSGFSISIFQLGKCTCRLRHLDSECKAPAWVTPYRIDKQDVKTQAHVAKVTAHAAVMSMKEMKVAALDADSASVLKQAIQAACISLMSLESRLNELDSEIGDGDCGSSHRAGAQAIITGFTDGSLTPEKPFQLLHEMSALVEEHMGGTSGALYSLFLASCAKAFEKKCTSAEMVQALDYGVESLMSHGNVRPGDRSLVDPLAAALQTLQKDSGKLTLQSFQQAVSAAEERANATASMEARVGRASRVRNELVTEADPGAIGVAAWMQAMLNVYQRNSRPKT